MHVCVYVLHKYPQSQRFKGRKYEKLILINSSKNIYVTGILKFPKLSVIVHFQFLYFQRLDLPYALSPQQS